MPHFAKLSPATGVFVPKPHINKDLLRTAQGSRMCRVMADRHLDWLLFGLGEGMDLCRAICDEAFRPFRGYERQAYRHLRRI